CGIVLVLLGDIVPVIDFSCSQYDVANTYLTAGATLVASPGKPPAVEEIFAWRPFTDYECVGHAVGNIRHPNLALHEEDAHPVRVRHGVWRSKCLLLRNAVHAEILREANL